MRVRVKGWSAEWSHPALWAWRALSYADAERVALAVDRFIRLGQRTAIARHGETRRVWLQVSSSLRVHMSLDPERRTVTVWWIHRSPPLRTRRRG